ncbi:MAG: ubiquitin family protein, partial [Gammaproteobacteria bacterium]|nr:ubiquitin family protein [Gammaproteobacteria bacterium]
MPATTTFAAGNGKFITVETICMGLVFLAALPQGALPLPSAKCRTLESTASDAVAAVKAKTEADPKFDALSSKPRAEQMEWDEAASHNKQCSDQCNFVKYPVEGVGNSHSNQYKIDEPRSNQSIFVKSPDSTLITVPFHPLKKIFDVKREIERRLKLDPSDYSLFMYWGKRLDKDNLSLSDYGIVKDSTLVANVPMRAGMVATRSGSGSSAAKGVEVIAGMENESPREDPEKIPVAAAKSGGSDETEESRIGSPRGAQTKTPAQGARGQQDISWKGYQSFLESTRAANLAAAKIALPTEVEMEEVRGVKSSRRKLTPSRRKLESLELELPLVLGDAGGKRGPGPPPKETVVSLKDRQKKHRRKKKTLENEHKMKALEKDNTAKVWDRPGKDYNLADFAQNPETAVLLWHANTGSWRDREPKWLFGYVHLRNKLKAGGDVETLSKLNSIYQESIEDGVSLMRVCRERAKNNWPLIDAWQKEKRITSLEFAALEWLATEDFFVCDNDYKLLRKKRKQFIGLQLKVPKCWFEINGKQRPIVLDVKKRRAAEAAGYLCEIVDVDYKDEESRYFKIVSKDNGGQYRIGRSDAEQHASPSNSAEKERLSREFKCIDGKFEDVCSHALKALGDQADDTFI